MIWLLCTYNRTINVYRESSGNLDLDVRPIDWSLDVFRHGQFYCLFIEILFVFYTDTTPTLPIFYNLVHVLQVCFQIQWYAHHVWKSLWYGSSLVPICFGIAFSQDSEILIWITSILGFILDLAHPHRWMFHLHFPFWKHLWMVWVKLIISNINNM